MFGIYTKTFHHTRAPFYVNLHPHMACEIWKRSRGLNTSPSLWNIFLKELLLVECLNEISNLKLNHLGQTPTPHTKNKCGIYFWGWGTECNRCLYPPVSYCAALSLFAYLRCTKLSNTKQRSTIKAQTSISTAFTQCFFAAGHLWRDWRRPDYMLCSFQHITVFYLVSSPTVAF